jgi:uncharacterized membrane-anchored protein YjiN (DUF445 family)
MSDQIAGQSKAKRIVEQLARSGWVVQQFQKNLYTKCSYFWRNDYEECHQRVNDLLQEVYLQLFEICQKDPQKILDLHKRDKLKGYIVRILQWQAVGTANAMYCKFYRWAERRAPMPREWETSLNIIQESDWM